MPFDGEQLLLAEEQYLVGEQRLVNRRVRLGVERLGHVQPMDIGADLPGEGRDTHRRFSRFSSATPPGPAFARSDRRRARSARH